MSTPCEYTLVEKPIIELLTSEYGYEYIPPSKHAYYRDHRENEVFFAPLLIDALMCINNIPATAAKSITAELQGLTDNERWLEIMRGKYSKKVEGEDTHRTIKLVDFDDPANNHFAVTNQLEISGAKHCIPDLIIYLNGIPIVVIEAKSPLAPKRNTWKAVSQIQQYEENIPRLFTPNLFNIATNDLNFLYGTTGAPSEHWNYWRDPWPREPEDFFDATAQGVYALLAPDRLLDILAHFIIFETRDGKTIKKMCRYQQFRAVNKMVERVVNGQARQGLIWHTQGSGKSLTMVFAALKLKFHRGIHSERLTNPNLLVITDRKDLHAQISGTFHACGLPNPENASSKAELRRLVVPGVVGRTVLATIFKFHADIKGLKSKDVKIRKKALAGMAVAGSENWILMVDEAHRTQEKDLGAYMRAMLPDAVRFGFTGTPIKKGDKDTYDNFGVPGENYLDRYDIEDAVKDGATVPVYYQGRLTEWHVEGAELDILFDQWFANEPPERIEEIKARGVTRGDLARFEPRIARVAYDIWTHYKEHLEPDGFKAQIVAIDRLACVAYKKRLDRVITKAMMLEDEEKDKEEAAAEAAAMSLCVYSPGQHDQQEHPELVTYQLDESQEKEAIANFNKPDHPLKILIVCNKLLTGFDAPIEQAMYLDKPLTDHNLLQAIARTNRRYGKTKRGGSIIDYSGVSKSLGQALANYNDDDVKRAMVDNDERHAALVTAHREVMNMLVNVLRTENPKEDAKSAIFALEAEDTWFEFLGKAHAFMVAYGDLSPDPRILIFKADLQFIGSIIPYGKRRFEADTDEIDWRQYSAKIRKILNLHLEVTGLSTIIKLRSLADPSFWEDFKKENDDLYTAAVRKLVELKKETTERTAKNPARYGKFSERIKKLIEAFQKGLLSAAEVMNQTRELARDVDEEDKAPDKHRLNENAYGLFTILEKHEKKGDPAETDTQSRMEDIAAKIDDLYRNDELASAYWQDKPQSRKRLLQKVRRLLRGRNFDWAVVKVAIDKFAINMYGKP